MAKEKKENMYELYFEWWLNALKNVGLVKDWKKEPETVMVLPPFTIYSHVHMVKKQSKIASHDIFKIATYTRDYDVWIHRSLLEVIFGVIKKDDNIYILHETVPKTKGDAYFDFSYYYLFDATEAHLDYVRISFDVKPLSTALQFSGSLGSSREFPYNQKLMLEHHNILVNKVVPIGNSNCLFAKTFTPERFFFTDGGRQGRKINFKTKTLEQYMLEKGLKKIQTNE